MTHGEPLDDGAVRALMADGRVNRRLYTDPELFQREMRTIFRNAWLYVGHES